MKNLRLERKRRLAQRDPSWPGQRKIGPVSSLYDRILDLVDRLSSGMETAKESENSNTGILAAFKNTLETIKISDDMNAEDFKDILNTIWNKFVEIDLDFCVGEEDVRNDLKNIANEIKQVALSTHGGTTSPIDLGEWLY